MLDILQYLYEHYLVDDHYPDNQALALKLSTVGFDQAEIAQALEWLDGLSALDPEAEAAFAAHAPVSTTRTNSRGWHPRGVVFSPTSKTPACCRPMPANG